MIRLADPAVDEAGRKVVADVLAGGQLVQGAQVGEFERLLAARAGVQHAVAVNSGTSALHLALLALGIRPGDRVAVASYSYPATANAIELCGARPVFVDVRGDTFNIDVERLRQVLEDAGGSIRAILPVHAFGQPCEMDRIAELAEAHGAAILEDAACALGARWQGRAAGAWGDAGCFSFHPRKAITTGEGGAVTTPRAEVARVVRSLRNHGQEAGEELPDFVQAGGNLRMTEMQGALGVYQMGRLEAVIARRRALAAEYDRLLAGSQVGIPAVLPGAEPVYQSYVVTLRPEHAARRRPIIERLGEFGVEATIGTYAIPLLTFYRRKYGLTDDDFPVAAEAFRRSLAIPLHERLTPEDQSVVVDSLTRALDEASRHRGEQAS